MDIRLAQYSRKYKYSQTPVYPCPVSYNVVVLYDIIEVSVIIHVLCVYMYVRGYMCFFAVCKDKTYIVPCVYIRRHV